MFLGVVVGNVVATHKEPNFTGNKLLAVEIVEESGNKQTVVAIDAVGAGVGDRVVVLVEGGSARMILDNPNAPTNTVIAGIIDQISVNK